MLAFILDDRAGRRLAGVMALLVLAVIAFDLGDAGCDPVRVGLGPLRISAGHDETSDTCSDLCIPDCFCCATTVAATEAAIAFPPGAAPGAPPAPPTSLVTGFTPIVEHVPLSAA